MGKCGNTAVRAVEILRESQCTAEAAWRQAAAEMFSGAPAARAKACPFQAFIGLCQQGLIIGVEPDRCASFTPSSNREYATAAVRLVCQEPGLAVASKTELWRNVMKEVGADLNKKHNQQLDVVLTLLSQGLLARSG